MKRGREYEEKEAVKERERVREREREKEEREIERERHSSHARNAGWNQVSPGTHEAPLANRTSTNYAILFTTSLFSHSHSLWGFSTAIC